MRPALAACAGALWLAGSVASVRAEKTGDGSLAAPSRAALGAPAVLSQLASLPPLDRIERIQALAPTEPAALVLAAVAAEPALLEERRAKIEALVGAANVPALREAALTLQVESRADETVMDRLRSIAGASPPEALLDKGRWYDGGAAASASAAPAGSVRLTPALVWPADPEAGLARAVHTLSAHEDRLLINGKEAHTLRDARVRDGVRKELLIHPDDPGLLVALYHSKASLESFAQMDAKLAGLLPLSKAGAAARVLEHGEAAIPGKGRVYFFVQQLVDGLKLEDMPAEKRPWGEVDKLIERLAQAGLAVDVRGPDPAWLLSRVMVGRAGGEASRAYLLAGELLSLEPGRLADHIGMLRSLLGPSTEPLQLAAAAQPAERLGTLAGADALAKVQFTAQPGRSLETIAARHGLARRPHEDSDAPPSRLVQLDGEKAAVTAAVALAGDPEVAQVKTHRDVRRQVERLSNKDLPAMLALMPEGPERDRLVLKLSGPAFARTAGSDVAALLSLLSASASLGAVPEQAWLALSAPDAQRLIKRWAAAGAQPRALEAARAWITARAGRLGEAGATGRDVHALLAPSGDSAGRDQALLALPPAAYGKMSADELVELLLLVDRGYQQGYGQPVYKNPALEPAWTALDGAGAAALVKRLASGGHGATAAVALQVWMNAHAAELGSKVSWAAVAAMLEPIGELPERDELILGLPHGAWARMGGAEAASLLNSVSVRSEPNNGAGYNRLPKEAWQRLSPEDLARVVKRWVALGYADSARIAVERWLEQTEKPEAGALLAVARLLPEGTARDALIPVLAAATRESEPLGDLLALVSKSGDGNNGSVYGKVGGGAWTALAREDAQRLIKHWRALGYQGSAAAVLRLWAKEHPAWDDVKPMVELTAPESTERDGFILAVPADAYAKAKGADVAALLALVSKAGDYNNGSVYGKIAAAAWGRLSGRELAGLLQPWTAVGYHGTTGVMAAAWAAANGAWEEVRPVLDALPAQSTARDALLGALSAASLAGADSAQLAAALGQVSAGGDGNQGNIYKRLPAQAWKALGRAEAAALVKQWVVAGQHGSAYIVASLWIKEHQAWDDCFAVLSALPPQTPQRDALIAELPAAAFSKAPSAQLAEALTMVTTNSVYYNQAFFDKLPAQAWQALERADAERVIKHWSGYATAAANMLAGWSSRHEAWPDRLAAVLLAPADSAARDQLIAGTSGAAFAKAPAVEIVEMLGLVSANGDANEGRVYGQVSSEAWRALTLRGAESLARRWTSASRGNTAAAIVGHWLRVHAAELGGPEAPAAALVELLSAAPEGDARDAMLLKLPDAAFERASGAESVALLSLLSRAGGHRSLYEKVLERRVSDKAWARMGRDHAAALARRWAGMTELGTAAAIVELWLAAHEKDGSFEDRVELLKTLPASDERDAAVLKTPAAAFAKAGSEGAEALLALLRTVCGAVSYKNAPAEAWRALSGASAAQLVRRALAESQGQAAAAAVQMWLVERARGLPDGLGADLLEALRALPEDGARDQTILAVPGAAYEAMESREVAAVLGLLNTTSEANPSWIEYLTGLVNKLPHQAWSRLAAEDAQPLFERRASPQPNMSALMKKLWEAASAARAAVPKSRGRGASLLAAVRALPESADTDRLILKAATEDLAALSGAELAELLARLDRSDAARAGESLAKVPRQAWTALDEAGMSRLVERFAPAQPENGRLVARLWLEARR